MKLANLEAKTATTERGDLVRISAAAVAQAETFDGVARWIEEALGG